MAFEGVAYGFACLWIPQANVTIVTTRSEFAFHRFPLYAKHPAFMTGQNMRWRLCE